MPAVSLTRNKYKFKNAIRSLAGFGFSHLWSFIPRSVYLGKSPKKLLLAITRKCNANCVFCAYQYARKEDKIHMSEAMFETVLEEIQCAQIDYVMLSPNIGEPTIVPNFIEKVNQLRNAGVKSIEVTTNALYLNKIGLEEILTKGPDIINISFAGFNKEMYERDFRVKHYERTRENILGLMRLNKTLDTHKTINLRLRGDLPFTELLSSPEMEEVSLLTDDVEVMTEVDDWMGLIKKDTLPEGYVIQKDSPDIKSRPCSMLFDLTVHPDGDIHLCACRNIFGDPDLHIGNIKEMSLLNAHEKIQDIMSRWESGSYPDSCQSCSMYCDPANALIGRWRELRS